jgi:DNA polymerase-3 subunit alpha
MMEELTGWLKANKIRHEVVDDEVVDIPGFGKMYCEDTETMKSIFRIDPEGNVKFNSMASTGTLQEEEIYYIAFRFGDNWYYFDTRKDFRFNILKYIGEREECCRKEKFVNLGVHTPFELLNGSFGLKDWVRKAVYLGHGALGICDTNTMAASLLLQKECKAAGIRHVFGYSLTFTTGTQKVEAKIYVQTQEGWQHLLRIQKAVAVDSEDGTIALEELLAYGRGNVIVFGKRSGKWLAEMKDRLHRFYDFFDGCYFQLDLSEYKAERIDLPILESAKAYFTELYDQTPLRPVLIGDCYYLDRDDAKNKILLNKIAGGAAHEQSDDQYFKDTDEHWETAAPLFGDGWDTEAIFSEACGNTLKIAEGAVAEIETGRNFMPQYDLTPEERERYGDRHRMFRQLLEEGFRKLVPKGQEERYRKQLEHEVYVLESTNNVDYMLVQYDTVNWARKNGVMVGCGRGSAGGCLVLYLLGITLVDPIKYDLLFERFLLPERAGLYPAQVTVIGEDMESDRYVELELENGRTYRLDRDAQLMVKRNGAEEPVTVYADELREDDDILFDNRDLLFTLNEI